MELRDDLLDPISGDNPAGENLRYEPVYDLIKDARTEEEDIPQGDWERERKTADFGRVIQLAQDALATQTKDLQLAAWLSEAMLREHGFQGFLQGLELIQGLVGAFWDDLYPEIEDGDVEFRATPLEWLAHYLDLPIKSVALNQAGHSLLDYVDAQAIGYESEDASYEKKTAREEAIAEGKLTPEDFDRAFDATPKVWYKETVAAIQGCLGAIDRLEEVGDPLFGDVAPSYRSLRESIGEVDRVAQKLLARKLEQDPDPPEPEPVLEMSGETAIEGAPSGGTPAQVSAVPTSRAEAAARIAEAARFLRSQDLKDPAPYGLLRGFRWAEVRGGGDPPNPRLLEAPPTQVRTRLKTLLLDERWAELLESAEDVMATAFGRGWLDLQRYVMTALAGLGPDYDAVRELVSEALAELLRDVPSLLDATLMDDSPTANRETRAWLQQEGIFEAGDGQSSTSQHVATKGSGASQLVRQARSRVRNGEPEEAVELLLKASEVAGHPREAFLTRTEAAAIMVENGLEPVARPLLDDMMSLIETHSLEGWEAGDTVATPLGLLYRVRKAAGEGVDDLYERIVRLDPVHAMRLRADERSREREAAAQDTGDNEGEV